jgi:hypothetical protein
MKLRPRWPRRRWWFHVAWAQTGGFYGYRLYTETFPWFTARDRIARVAWEFVRGEVGHDQFALLTLDFRPNRGRAPIGPYRNDDSAAPRTEMDGG